MPQLQFPELIAHRGASFDAPENTLAAIRLAWQQNADAVEIDVHLTRDGAIVAMHDDNTRRTAGLDAKIAEQTLAQLKALDAGSWKDAAFAGERIPTLDEILAELPAGKRLVIEVKKIVLSLYYVHLESNFRKYYFLMFRNSSFGV